MAKINFDSIGFRWNRLTSLWENCRRRWADHRRIQTCRSSEELDEPSWLECDDCGDTLRQLDVDGDSATYQCIVCGYCYLCAVHPEFEVLIWLRDFHRKRGDGPGQRPRDDLRMATGLVECLVCDCWPSPAAIVDFGIDRPSHLGALQYAVHSGVTAYELDRVLGDGPAITRLVRAIPDQPYQIEFRTSYDLLAKSEEEDDV